MALTGMQIFKFLPKTNCKDCGAPTCLGFAMNLAAGKTELDKCPHLEPQARQELAAAAAPPIARVTVGSFSVGDETVLFRHEKTFNNQPLLAAQLDDNDKNLKQKLEYWESLQWPRIGLTLRAEMVFLRCASNNSQRLLEAAQQAQKYFALSLQASPEILRQVLPELAQYKPLLCMADERNYQTMAELAGQFNCPLAVSAPGVGELSRLSAKISALGVKELVLFSQPQSLPDVLADNTAIRRAALLEKNSSLGFPVLNFVIGADKGRQVAAASLMIAKYAGIVVLDDFAADSLFALLLLRLNLYTDPQRPMTMGQGIYPVGNPQPDSPVVVTTNFSLTYFMVNGEIENSRVPAWLMIMDTEGLSVLTAWAAGRFVGDTIGDFIRKSGIIEKINHRKLIIPGFVASIKDELAQAMPGWEIIVGPREASSLPKLLKSLEDI